MMNIDHNELGLPKRGSFERRVWDAYASSKEPRPTGDIATELGVPAARVRAAVQRLEAKGLLAKYAMGVFGLP